MSPPPPTSRPSSSGSATRLQPLEIVVVNTSAGAKYGRPDYVASGCGMGDEATMYLLERGVRADRHRRLELGRAVRPHRQAICRDA